MWENENLGEFDIPQDFECPISLEPMKEPVVASDGHCYEKKYIKQWTEKNDTSPMTGEKLQHKFFYDNISLKKIINQYTEYQI